MKITQPGIYHEFPAEAYHADPCPSPSLNHTVAKILIERSPLHARYAHPRLSPLMRGEAEREREYSKDMAIGSAVHALVLGRGGDLLEIIDAPDFRSKAAQMARDEALSRGKTPILSKHLRTADIMVTAIQRQIEGHCLAGILKGGRPEVVIAWQEDGIWLRSMIDYLRDDLVHIVDLKTTAGSASPHAVPWLMADSCWDVQAAMIERGLNRLDKANIGRRTFRFILAENSPPYALTIHELPESVVDLGRRKIAYAVKIWRECLRADRWPGYEPLIYTPAYPAARETQWLDREIEMQERGRP